MKTSRKIDWILLFLFVLFCISVGAIFSACPDNGNGGKAVTTRYFGE